MLPKSLLEGALYAFDSVIKGNAVEGNAVEVHVSRLRQKLGARLIETRCGPGQCRHDRRTGQALVAALPSDLQRVLVIGGWLATIALSALVLDHEMREMFDQDLEILVETTVLSLDMAQGPLRAQHRRGRPRWRKVLCASCEGMAAPAPWPPLTMRRAGGSCATARRRGDRGGPCHRLAAQGNA